MSGAIRVSYLQVQLAPKFSNFSLNLVNNYPDVSYPLSPQTLTYNLLVSEPQPKLCTQPPRNIVISPNPGDTILQLIGPQNYSMVKPFKTILIIVQITWKTFKLIQNTKSIIN